MDHMLKLFVSGQNIFYRIRHNQEGQTMAEYGVVLAVITLGIIVALTALSTGISGALGRVTSKLGVNP